MIGLLGAVPLLYRIIAGAVIVGAIVGAFAWYHHTVYEEGYTAAINAVAAKDEAAIKRMQNGQANIAACRSRAGEWDVTTGTCSK